MRNLPVFLIALLVLVTFSQFSFAEIQNESVDKNGEWYLGEGLEKGDFFSYNLCHVNYNNCTEFEIQLWIEDEIVTDGSKAWIAQIIVYEDDKVIKGEMSLDSISFKLLEFSSELEPYVNSFRDTISIFNIANVNDPKAFNQRWGTTGQIAGGSISPSFQTITIPAGTFEGVEINWSVGAHGHYFILDEFPFPIEGQAFVVTYVADQIQEFDFELLDAKKDVTSNPFSEVEAKSMPVFAESTIITTDKKFYYTEDTMTISASGMHEILDPDNTITMIGSSPSYFIGGPLWEKSGEYTVRIRGGTDSEQTTFFVNVEKHLAELPVDKTSKDSVPEWIQINAEWWADDILSDTIFTDDIKFMMDEGIIEVSNHSTSDVAQNVPDWIKLAVDWWVLGLISDSEYVNAIQYMVENEIIIV